MAAIESGKILRPTVADIMGYINEVKTGDLITEGILTTNNMFLTYFSPLESVPYIKVGPIVIANFKIVGNPTGSTQLSTGDRLTFGAFNFEGSGITPITPLLNLTGASDEEISYYTRVRNLSIINSEGNFMVRPDSNLTVSIIKTFVGLNPVMWLTNE